MSKMLSDECNCPEVSCPPCVRKVVYKHIPQLTKSILHDFPKVERFLVDLNLEELTWVNFFVAFASLLVAFAVYQSIENYFFVPSIDVKLTAQERKGKTGKKWIPNTP